MPPLHLTTLSVSGMMCQNSCGSTVANALRATPGVLFAAASYADGSATVLHDAETSPVSGLVDAIDMVGFDAAPSATTPSSPVYIHTFTVAGMMCQNSCGSTVAQALRSAHPSVVAASASHARSSATCYSTCPSAHAPCVLSEEIEDVGFEGSHKSSTVLGIGVHVAAIEELVSLLEDSAELARPLPPTPDPDPVCSDSPSLYSDSAHASGGPVRAFFSISGMSCASCSSSIERHVSALPGVDSVKVALLAEKASVVITDTSAATGSSILEVVDTVTGLGFVCVPLRTESLRRASDTAAEVAGGRGVSDTPATIQLLVTGMSCASCSSKIERHVGSLPHVQSCSVSLLTGRLTATVARHNATLSSSPPPPGARDLVAAIESLGFGAAPPASGGGSHSPTPAEANGKAVAEWRRLFLFSLSLTVPVFLLHAILPHMPGVGPWLDTHVVPRVTWQTLLQMVFATPVQFGVGARFYRAAWRGLMHGNCGMDFLVAMGTTSAYAYSIVSVAVACMVESFHGHHFFETSAMLLTFVVMGKLMEAHAKGKTSEALTKLMELQPQDALLVEGMDGEEEEDSKVVVHATTRRIPIALVQTGDLLKVLPGSSLPVDGRVERGASSCNEAMITGEAMPVSKERGDEVFGGTINNNGVLFVRATRVGDDTAISQIVRLVEDAQTSKAPIQKFADRVSAVFAPTVCALAALTFAGWFILLQSGAAPEQWQEDARQSGNNFVFSFLFGIAVLVIACPCALGLATPTAVMVGTGVGARLGILIKGGGVLEAGWGVRTVLFDKTGTLTTGEFEVREVVVVGGGADVVKAPVPLTKKQLVFLAASAELGSEHPLAAAVVRHAEHDGMRAREPRSSQALPGRGVVAEVDSATLVGVLPFPLPSGSDTVEVLVGNRRLMQEKSVDVPSHADNAMQRIEHAGETAVAVAVDQRFVGVMAIADSVKDDAAETIAALRSVGIDVRMITGDSRRTAMSVAKRLGLHPSKVTAEVLPEDKAAQVLSLQGQPNGGAVAMVGDGINDSPALAQADVGIAIGSGSQIAIESADMVLVREALMDVTVALDLSRTVFRRIRMNFVWAMGYNLVGIPIAAGVLYPFLHVGLPPQFAGLAMAFSSVSVVCSSLHLRWYKSPKEREMDSEMGQGCGWCGWWCNGGGGVGGGRDREKMRRKMRLRRGGKEADMDRRRGKYSKVVEEEEEEEEEEQLQGARMVEMV